MANPGPRGKSVGAGPIARCTPPREAEPVGQHSRGRRNPADRLSSTACSATASPQIPPWGQTGPPSPGKGAPMPISLWAPLLSILIAIPPPAADPGAQRPQAASPGAVVAAATADPGWQRPIAGPVVRHFTPPASRWARGHRGVDLAVSPGVHIRAAGTGIVVYAGTIAGRGVISIEHAGGLRTTYEPVEPLVSRGMHVRSGQPIAVHAPDQRHPASVHWGLRVRGAYVDPLLLLRRGSVLKPIPLRPLVIQARGWA